MRKTTVYIGAGFVAVLLVLMSLVFIKTVLYVAKQVHKDSISMTNIEMPNDV